MKKIILLFAFIAFANIYSENIYNDGELVNRISKILIENYDKKPSPSILEKIIKASGKKTYINMLNIWKKKYNDVSSVKFDIDPRIQKIINVVRKNLPETKAENLENNINELMILTLLNFNLYLDAIKNNPAGLSINKISCSYIDECLSVKKYYNIQKNLYEREIF